MITNGSGVPPTLGNHRAHCYPYLARDHSPKKITAPRVYHPHPSTISSYTMYTYLFNLLISIYIYIIYIDIHTCLCVYHIHSTKIFCH